MARSKNIITLLMVCYATIAFSQENVLLKREFWKTNPSIQTIDQKIAEGNDASELNPYAFDPVVYAILENASSESIIHLLSKEGNDVNKLTHDGRTYIFWAAYKNNQELVQYLIDKDAKMNIIDDHGNTVLTFAASTGQTDPKLYDLLLNNGASINETNRAGASILLLAAPNVSSMDELHYFINKGLSITSTDEAGNGIFNYTARTGNIDMLNALIEKGATPTGLNKDNGNAMLFAAQGTRGQSNGLEIYEFLESKGVNPNVTTREGNTPLHILAYRNKDEAIFNYFIKKGVDVNQVNDDGNTALINAAASSNLSIVTLLANKTKDINHTNKKGQSALTMAVENNTADVVSFLLKKGADASVVDENNNTLLFYTIQSYSQSNEADFDKKLKILKQNGVSLSEVQEKENTLYHLAVSKNSKLLLKRVVKMVPKNQLQQKNSDGLTPLHLAAMNAKDESILKFLISMGADKNTTTDFGETAFDLAQENEQLKANKTDLTFLK
ncbi:ankyrin repeat domain-containing protein [Marixanthomonas sp. SCSIO 43207]|uniref:ankyrin repeat domain-containing protein n=1 Tax=Marixanthomonas sp. SCSIO 43207 TaxID=2779360 RepID=UPI0021075813|nr:ankyrin repeat domain-containing protein [Marixanthomonas sp. SCSIO 43207]